MEGRGGELAYVAVVEEDEGVVWMGGCDYDDAHILEWFGMICKVYRGEVRSCKDAGSDDRRTRWRNTALLIAGWTKYRVIASGWSDTDGSDKLSLHIMPGRSMSDALYHAPVNVIQMVPFTWLGIIYKGRCSAAQKRSCSGADALPCAANTL